MKKIVLVAITLQLFGSAQGQTIYPSGVTNCIARWDFSPDDVPNNVLPDVSNNNNAGAISNLTPAPGFKSKPNAAMHFNGTNSVVVVPHKTILNPQAITIVALVRPNDFYNGLCQYNNIIYKGYNYYIPGNWSMCITEDDYDLNCNNYSPTKEQLDFAGSAEIPHSIPANNFITPNNWYFLALTYDGDTVTRYQVLMDTNFRNNNVQPLSKYQLNTPLGTNTYNVYIGATQQPTYPYWFNGDMDELALFNKELTTAEIQSVYNYLWGNPTAIGQTKNNKQPVMFASNGVLRVNNYEERLPYSINILGTNGQLLYKANNLKGAQAIDLTQFSSQLFIVTIKDEQHSFTQKVQNF